jgi:hypothetical protein
MTKSRTFKDFRAAYNAGHLLDLEMPNGRALRDCTADDCFAYGGWLKDVGWRVRHGWRFRHGNGDDQIYHAGKMTVGDAYEAWGAQASQRNIVGQLLKFNKGRWVTGGANNELVEVEPGTKLIVNMASLMVGWQKWQNDRPVDSHMGYVNENYQPPLRRTIGDNKEDGGWEPDEDGVLRDPWQPSNMVVMRELGTTG